MAETVDRRFDSIVLGLGAMGSAALYQLARRGQRVLGIERFTIGHARGSSHGSTRVIRRAYFEHPDYVPLLHRAYALWDELAAATVQELFLRSGVLLLGAPGDPVLSGARLAANRHGLDLLDLSAAELSRRYPGLRTPTGFVGVLEPDAGYLRVEACVRAHVAQAVHHGATVQTETPVRAIHAAADEVSVETDAGRWYADKLVVCGGAYSGDLLRDLALPLTVRRKVQLWYGTQDASLCRSAGFPVFLVSDPVLGGVFYGFPVDDLAEGLKVAEHSGGQTIPDPLAVDREIGREDEARVRDFLGRFLPSVSGTRRRHEVCLYTMTPDEHFLIDRHPQHERVVFAAGFSGHGFKFAAAVGEALADLAIAGQTALPIGFLSLARLAVIRP